MIREVLIKDPERTILEWWPKVKAFQGKNSFKFTPGLNVLWGPNGSGKSTLLRLIARLTHCEQGGTPLVTSMSLGEATGSRWRLESGQARDAVELDADGRPVHFFDPTSTPGLMGGTFDDDFFSEGLTHTMHGRKTSSGEQVQNGLGRIFQSAISLETVPWKRHKPPTADTDYATKWLVPHGAAGPRTILLDEPDRSLSVAAQREQWYILTRQTRFQLIVATHSVFALHIPGATYIDVQEGDLRASRKAVRSWMSDLSAPRKGWGSK
jgi:energy-coupling factor transporter ATP-binding protein EcfA2